MDFIKGIIYNKLPNLINSRQINDNLLNNNVIFIGNIYNFKNIMNDLHEFYFKTKSEEEIIYYSYKKWGIKCFNKFNGNWSIIIYDDDNNKIIGSRDRFGTKSLYYIINNNYFAFSSEIKHLLTIKDFNNKLNINAANSYLLAAQDYFEEETFFENIYELKPSHYFIYDKISNDLKKEKYYDLNYNNEYETFDNKKSIEYIHETKNKILQAVDIRLCDNINIGSCLSGGLDSSSIVCSINKLLKNRNNEYNSKLNVITSCYNDSNIDETKWAKYVTENTPVIWHKVFPKENELLDDLFDLIYTQDIPFCSTSVYSQYRIMKAAKEIGLKTMFDGQGGDELFTGYTPFYSVLYSEIKRNKDFSLLKNEQKNFFNTPFLNKNINNFINYNNFKNFIKRSIPLNIKNILKKFISNSLNKYIFINGESYKNYFYNTLNQMLYTMMIHTSLPQLLRYADRNATRFSISTKMPFADDIDLIEYIFKIPGVYKIHNGWSKYLLRESMSDIIPKEIKERKDKIGFATPEYKWLKSMKSIVFDNITPEINEIIKVKQFKNDWDKIYNNLNLNNTANLWRIINFILWFKIMKITL